MRINVYDTFEDEVATMDLAKKLQSEGMESMKQPHLWSGEPIRSIKAMRFFTSKSRKMCKA